ncbi:polyketide cyclase [Roseivivax halodurans JCM 10272]|uniref:Polyketide cyclase n=1 Tax=Roseivivax halodurans JCM 10272 TaxID=1449350 RepID=X7EJ42_9RHOB|nr:polyketide cyclase [Roseivivax halodurans JCM 10272]
MWRRADFARPVERHLEPNVVLRAPETIRQGRVAVATEALGLLAAFPDQVWHPEDALVWTSRATRLVAERRVVTARHAGGGLFGDATGRAVSFRVLSETAMREGRLVEIWRVSDRAAIVSQLGLSPERWAEAVLAGRNSGEDPFVPSPDVPAVYTGRGETDGWGATWADLVERAMEGAFGLIDAQYARGAELCHPGSSPVYGAAAARTFWLGLRAAFPSARFEVQHAFGLEAPLMPPRAALRWSLTGSHDGWGAFGAPTGADVHVMGLSQAEFGPEGVRREWTLFDPGAVWMQILLGGKG